MYTVDHAESPFPDVKMLQEARRTEDLDTPTNELRQQVNRMRRCEATCRENSSSPSIRLCFILLQARSGVWRR